MQKKLIYKHITANFNSALHFRNPVISLTSQIPKSISSSSPFHHNQSFKDTFNTANNKE